MSKKNPTMYVTRDHTVADGSDSWQLWTVERRPVLNGNAWGCCVDADGRFCDHDNMADARHHAQSVINLCDDDARRFLGALIKPGEIKRVRFTVEVVRG